MKVFHPVSSHESALHALHPVPSGERAVGRGLLRVGHAAPGGAATAVGPGRCTREARRHEAVVGVDIYGSRPGVHLPATLRESTAGRGVAERERFSERPRAPQSVRAGTGAEGAHFDPPADHPRRRGDGAEQGGARRQCVRAADGGAGGAQSARAGTESLRGYLAAAAMDATAGCGCAGGWRGAGVVRGGAAGGGGRVSAAV
eukprot:ctg_1983.g420